MAAFFRSTFRLWKPVRNSLPEGRREAAKWRGDTGKKGLL
jgi:hypothetical protein